MVPAALEITAAPVVILMAFGVILATVGHMWKSRSLILTGLLILFVATAAMVIGGYAAYEEGTDPDPRPQKDPREPGF
ncbi:MAG TPA: hypothetical protein VHF89_07120 [Solirubrobacteraceae bacterium]|nr:hypothetical protein [Solirubrobacteraceae bacterium]